MTTTNPARTRAVLGLVLKERAAQEARYGEANLSIENGTGPRVRWLGPYTGDSASTIQRTLRMDYEDFEDAAGAPTWVHLVREEIAEAFQETDPERLAEELVQVAALCVSWVERLGAVRCEACGSEDGTHQIQEQRLCHGCLDGAVHGG